MEGKDKKKESIDEILSDLNGLLNKMPSILDGIKMPELQPMESPKPKPEPEPEPAPEPAKEETPPLADADKTVVLQPFSGLPEGAAEPVASAEPSAEPSAAQAPEQPVELVIERPAELPAEPPVQAAGETLAPQSLGDFMFGQDSEPEAQAAGPGEAPSGPAKLSGEALEPPAEEARAASLKGPSLSISEFTPPAQEQEPAPQPEPEAEAPQAELPAAALPAYDSTKDFGVPDIDALMQLSEGDKPEPAPEQAPQPAQEAGVIPESVQAMEEQAGGLSIQGLSEAEPKPAPEVETVEPNDTGKEENAAAPGPGGLELPAQEPAPVIEEPALSAAETEQPQPAPQQPQEQAAQPPQEEPAAPQLQADSTFDSFAIDTSAQEPAPGQDGGETLRLEPQAALTGQEGGEAPAPEAAAEPQPQAEPQAEPQAAPAAEPFGSFGGIELPGEAAPAAAPAAGQPLEPAGPAPEPAIGGIELSPAIDLGGPRPEPFSSGQGEPSGADQTIPGGSGLELGGAPSPSGEETLVVQPPSVSASSGEEEKTVIFQASPATTSRAQAGDLASLAAKTVPEGIPAERVRSLMFLYSMEDKTLCATVLAELDAICLKSATKPMFIKRASVRECDPDANPNFVQQSAAESGAQGIICLGNVPQDKVTELEGVVTSGGGFFRYYDSSSFNHSSALDLVTDLILR